MKFSTYQPAVDPNVLQNVPVRVSRDLNAYGNRGAQWKAIGQIAGIGLEMQQKVTDGKVLEANAEYNRLMSEGTALLMQKKEGEALNITDDYDRLQKDVLADVKQRYGGYIGFGAGQEAFNAYTMRDDATRRSGVVKYQQAQTDAYQETQYNNQLADCRNTALEGGGTIESVTAALNRMDAVVDSRFQEYGGEKLTEQKRIAAGLIVGDAVSMAINNGDFAKAETLLSTYKGVLPTNAYIDARSKLHKQQEIRREYIAVDDIAAQCRDVNGKIDLARGRAMIESLYGKDAVRTGGGMDENANAKAIYERFKQAGYSDSFIAGVLGRVQQEHNFQTSDVPISYLEDGTEVGGYGMFQWTKGRRERLLNWAQETGRDPQDPYAQADFALIEAEERGLTPDRMNGLSHEEAADVWTDKWEVGERGNEREYANEWLERIQQPGSAYDPEKVEKMMRMLKAKSDSESALQRQAESAEYENLLNQMQNAGDYYAAYDMAINSGLPMNKINQAVNAAAAYYNVKRDGTPRSGAASAEGPQWEGKPYNPKKDEKLFAQMDIIFKNGKNPTAKQWVDMESAADAIVGSGILTEEGVAELSDVYAEAMPMLADYLDQGHSIPEAYELLIDAGADPKIACIAIAKVHRSYKAIGKAEPYEEEEETGG